MRCLQASHSRLLWRVLVIGLAGLALARRDAWAQQDAAEKQGRSGRQNVTTGVQERGSEGSALEQASGAVGVAGGSSDQGGTATDSGTAPNAGNPAQPQAEGAAAMPSDAAAVAGRVDELLAEEVFAHLSPSEELAPIAGDQVFLRRAALDLLGENPTPLEVIAFSLENSPDKRVRVLDQFLAEPRFGRNWARYWRDTIFYRRAEDRALIAAPATEEFLTEKFNQNVGWNLIAREFIVATGNIRENGQTAVFVAQNGMTEDITAEISRIFMGIQIQCAQCHDHPTDRWKREQFHELAAFFPRVALRPERIGDIRSFAVVSDDRAFPPRRINNAARFGQPEHYMPDLKNPEARGSLMTPTFFVTGQKLKLGATDLERRQTLAEWMTSPQNPWFAKAFVNRVWGELVGEGFYEPLDDLGPDRPCSAPRTLEYLAGQFEAHKYDIKWLYRTIMLTQAYQRESRPRRTSEQTPFLANCNQRLRSDQIFSCLTNALGLRFERPLGGMRQGRRYGVDPRFLFAQVFGYDPSEPRQEVTGTIPQALLLMNSPLFSRLFQARGPGSEMGRLLAAERDDEAVVVELYLRCLARQPSEAEVKVCLEHVRTSPSRPEAFEDLLWSLVNTTEFLYRP